MLERRVQHLVCSFSMNNFFRLVEVPFRTQNSSEWNMRNVKVGFRKNEYYQADQLPRFTRYECQSRHLLVQDELEQLSVSSVFWEANLGRNAGNANLEAKPEQRWIESCIQASEASRFSESHTGDLAKREKFEPVKSCFPLSFFHVFFENVPVKSLLILSDQDCTFL